MKWTLSRKDWGTDWKRKPTRQVGLLTLSECSVLSPAMPVGRLFFPFCSALNRLIQSKRQLQLQSCLATGLHPGHSLPLGCFPWDASPRAPQSWLGPPCSHVARPPMTRGGPWRMKLLSYKTRPSVYTSRHYLP